MLESIYPIKFKPILKEKIWGGNNLADLFNKHALSGSMIGESWEISGFPQDISIVANGFLKDNSLQEIIEIYMADLVGEHVYEKFGIEFPLLIKFIDATDILSIQVHPDDAMALKRHHAFGKTEMWYIIKAEPGAELINGFKIDTDKSSYLSALNSGNIESILNHEKVKQGDVFFIPPGRIHAIGKGILLAEIQQTSDITYRVYDYGRTDNEGNPRELHTGLALDVIDYSAPVHSRVQYETKKDESVNLIECQYFTTNIIEIEQTVEKDYNLIDSFVIYICIEGSLSIKYRSEKTETLEKGETVLIPANLKNLSLIPGEKSKIIEIYIPEI